MILPLILGGIAALGSVISGVLSYNSASDRANMLRRQEADRKNQIKNRNERSIKSNSSSGSGSVELGSVDSSYLYSELDDYVQSPNPMEYFINTITSATSNAVTGYMTGMKFNDYNSSKKIG